MTSSKKAFTLIELLIVIAILGILMSLLFPAVNSAIDSARKAQAKNDVTQIATAIVAYETEYGRLPVATESASDVNSDLVNILTGATGNTNNPRKIAFLEVQAAKKGKSGTNSSGDFLDPWGGRYKVIVDANNDNTISSAGTSPGAVASGLRKKVAVWNDVNTQTNPKPNTGQMTRRWVVSWE